MSALKYGDSAARLVSRRVADPVATVTALKAIKSKNCYQGMTALVTADNSNWRYSSTSVVTGDDVFVAAPADGATGRWLRTDKIVDIPCAAVTFATNDGVTVFTIPTGAIVVPTRGYWVNSIAWSGGSSSTVALASSNAGASTAGDLQGGAAGDAAAAMGTGTKLGTVGAKVNAVVLVAADTITFERITSVYTAGAGIPHVVCTVLANAGA